MIYEFRTGARIPAGATADGVAEERDQLDKTCGTTVAKMAPEVLDNPDDYPNLRAFCPATAEEALLEGAKRGIQTALAAVVKVRVLPGKGSEESRTVEVRQIHATNGGWESIEVIASDEEKRHDLMARLQAEVVAHNQSVQSVLAEIADLILGGERTRTADPR